MRLLSTMYASGPDTRVTTRRGSLHVARQEGATRIPLNGLDAVILIGGAEITAGAITACVAKGVRVASCARNGRLRFTVDAPLSGNVHLRAAQHRASDDPAASLELARAFIAGKLQNSSRLIRRWARDTEGITQRVLADRADRITERLQHLQTAANADYLRGIEGDAARTHFASVATVLSEVPGIQFSTRQRRPPRDPVNALLGFCYGLLLTELQGATEIAGLDPQIGFLHRPRSGRASLALDLAEELRPLVDRFVVAVIRRHQIRPEHFEVMPGGAVYLSNDGRQLLLRAWERHKATDYDHPVLGRTVQRWALPHVQATLLTRHLRGDIDSYPPFLIPT